MKSYPLILSLVCLLAINFTGCAPKDSDLKAAVEQKLQTSSQTTPLGVEVKSGVVTLTGVCKDDESKAASEKMASEVKGVKGVNNLCTIALPAPLPAVVGSVKITPDDSLGKLVMDATKDYPNISYTIKEGIVTLTGRINRSSLPKLMMNLNSLHPKKIENKALIQ